MSLNENVVTRLWEALESFVRAPTEANKEGLVKTAGEYREHWILAQSAITADVRPKQNHRTPTTSYDRQMEVMRMVNNLPIKLALQQRSSVHEERPWWTLSWRTKYSAGGPNRRFYLTGEGYWTLPAAVALEMIQEMENKGGLGDRYLDWRRPEFHVQVSNQLSAEIRESLLQGITGPDEDWGADPYFVVCTDSNESWKKVMLIDRRTNLMTFRSITTNADYMPKKVLRPGVEWWLDNSMMDANVQQMRAFNDALQAYFRADSQHDQP